MPKVLQRIKEEEYHNTEKESVESRWCDIWGKEKQHDKNAEWIRMQNG